MTETATDRANESQQAIKYLEQLAEALTSLGLKAEVLSKRGGPAVLRVSNKQAPTLTENIVAVPTEGVWHYWWSWAERIVPVAELEEAAQRIVYVLTPQGDVG